MGRKDKFYRRVDKMKKLSELYEGTLLFSERTDEVVLVGTVREYIECGEEMTGDYHTIRFIGGGSFNLVEKVDVNN
jgi:hypothetical protein